MVRKPKADTGAASGDVALVLDYLRAQNRPFSVIEVSANLHNKVSKAKATKALQQLHEEGQIGGRTNGKQAVYHALQDAARSVTPQVLSTMNQEIEKLRTELADLKTSERKARMALAVFEANPRLSNLQEDIQRLEQERNGIREHLAILHDDNEVHLSPEERERLEREWEYWQSHATSRRRMCRDLWGRCTEVLPEGTSERELWESLGLEGPLQ